MERKTGLGVAAIMQLLNGWPGSSTKSGQIKIFQAFWCSCVINRSKEMGLNFSCLYFAVTFGASIASGALIGVDSTTGSLYSISEEDASLTAIGQTGIYDSWADIAFAPSGLLYGFTDSAADIPTLYTIDPQTASTTAVGSLGVDFVFEGGLAITPDGTAYGMATGSNGNAGLFTINLQTGAATVLGTVTGVSDVNGLVYRNDGNLIALDDNTDSLRVINPLTLKSSFFAAVPTSVGGLGGMTVENGVGYYVTAGPFAGGSDNLYSFNLFNGDQTLIGSVNSGNDGISGLAAIPAATPEPDSSMLCGFTIAIVFAWKMYRSQTASTNGERFCAGIRR